MTGQAQTCGACLVLLTAAAGLATAIRQRLPGAVSLGLLIAAGYEELYRLRLPAGFALLDDTAQWSRVWSHDGLEPQFTYTVWRTPAAPAATQGSEK